MAQNHAYHEWTSIMETKGNAVYHLRWYILNITQYLDDKQKEV